MALEILNAYLTEEEYLAQRFKQNHQTGMATQTPINNFKLFTKDVFGVEVIDLFHELRAISDTETQINKALVICQKFINWLGVAHPHIKRTRRDTAAPLPVAAKDPSVIRIYLSQIRLFIRKVGGIRLTSEDLSDFVSYPNPIEKEESEPLLPSEFKKICKRATHKRALLYRIKKDTCSRIGAMCQLRLKHFNTEVRPIEITFPKHIMKKKNGISYTVVKYVIKEDEEDLINHLKKFKDPEALIWGTSDKVVNAIASEEQYWRRLIISVGFTDRYAHSGNYKKNIHSIKAMSFTAAEEAVNETYANAYGDHSRYIKNYLRWSKEKKIEKFRKLEPHLTFFSRYELVTDDTLTQENDKLNQKVIDQEKLLEELTSRKKNETKVTVDEKTKELFMQLLVENNLL